MRLLVLTAFLVLPALALGQLRFHTQSGTVRFTSEAPAELIAAQSTALRGVLDTDTRGFGFIVAIESFDGFNSALQRQQFNENYLESTRHPEAQFAGEIIEELDFSRPGVFFVRARGLLTVHGISQWRTLTARLVVGANRVTLICRFQIILRDHGIKVPTLLSRKIAQGIAVEVNAVLLP